MNQGEAIDTVYSLIPRMVDEEPSGVLVKHAGENHLTLAQLEKLGHVFNTASTLITMEKDRTGIPRLINVPDMLSDYAGKLASSPRRASFLDDAPEQEEKVAAAGPEGPREVPHVWRQPVRKVAAAEPAPEAPVPVDWEKWANAGLDLVEAAREAIYNTLEDLNDGIDKIASDLSRHHDPSAQLAQLAGDMRIAIGETQSSMLTDKLAAALTRLGIEADRGRVVADPVVARDRTGFLEDATAAWENLKHASYLWEDGVRMGLDAAVSAMDERRIPFDLRLRIRKEAEQIQDFGVQFGFLAKEAAAAEVIPGPWPDSDRHAQHAARTMEDVEKKLKGPVDEAYGITGDLLGAGYHAGLSGITGLGQFAARDTPRILGHFGTTGEIGRRMEAAYGIKNRDKAQGMLMERKQLQRDVEAMATVQKLMTRDEVLATKDPEEVFNAFVSIRNASPEVAADPAMLRLMLRRALETQGVDVDTATAAREFEYGGFKDVAPSQRGKLIKALPKDK